MQADERSQLYWFVSDCFLQVPTASSISEISQALQIPVAKQEPLALEKEFTRLFRGIKEGYGPPPPYESLYRPAEFPTDVVEAVLSYYQAAGFNADEICLEPVDFLASELKLMALLAFKEAECIQKVDREQAALYQALQHKFLQNHIMVWVPDYCQRLQQASQVDFYRYLARYLADFLNELQDMWTDNAK